jgi:hypothetical protein
MNWQTTKAAGGRDVKIVPFLSGQAFDPELLDVMSAAFEGVCETKGLAIGIDPNAEVVARKIVELAQRGVRDRATLYRMTLEALSPET